MIKHQGTISENMGEQISFEDIEVLQKNPIEHIEKIQGVTTLESYQKELLGDILANDRIAVSACHCVGKSFTMAKVVLWAGSVYPGAKIITTAPTFLQVEKLLWSEINAGFRKSKVPLGGDMMTTQWKIDDEWFALGMSPKDDAGSGSGGGQGTQSRMQGFHAPYIVVIFDEATGIPAQRFVQAEGLLTSGWVKWICIGNPTSRNSEFFKCFQSAAWHKVHWSCFVSPNLPANGIKNMADLRREVDSYKQLSDEGKQKRLKSYKIIQPQLLTLSWVVAGIDRWGWNHPLTQSKILGNFPDEDDNALIRMADVERAQSWTAPEDPLLRSIGVDPARYGSDSTVITVLEGSRQTERIEMVKADTSEVAGRVVRLIDSLSRKKTERIVIDGTGLGAGVVDQLKERRNERVLPSNIEIREVHFGAGAGTAEDKEHYSNLKAKLFVTLAEDIKGSLSLLPESVYLEELPTILYKFDSKGRYVIESKDDYKKRTGSGSPDSADSLALANYGRHNMRRVGSMTKEISGSDGSMNVGTIVGSFGGDDW